MCRCPSVAAFDERVSPATGHDEIRFSFLTSFPSDDKNPVFPFTMQPTINRLTVFKQFRPAVGDKPKHLPVLCQSHQAITHKDRQQSHEGRDPLDESTHSPWLTFALEATWRSPAQKGSHPGIRGRALRNSSVRPIRVRIALWSFFSD